MQCFFFICFLICVSTRPEIFNKETEKVIAKHSFCVQLPFPGLAEITANQIEVLSLKELMKEHLLNCPSVFCPSSSVSTLWHFSLDLECLCEYTHKHLSKGFLLVCVSYPVYLSSQHVSGSNTHTREHTQNGPHLSIF